MREATLHDRPAVACTIIDHGPGMTEEQLKTLFTRFARPPTTTVDTERRSRRPEGVGLGLTVVHTVITRHEGTIECRSELGQGTAFNIVLPLCPPELLGEDYGAEEEEYDD
jgi:signal transduction histidine kinase